MANRAISTLRVASTFLSTLEALSAIIAQLGIACFSALETLVVAPLALSCTFASLRSLPILTFVETPLKN